MTPPAGPYRLVTVNNAPERAKLLIGRVVEGLKDQYTIIHVANCESLDLVELTVTKSKPDLLVFATTSQFCASMWTPEQSQKVFATAKRIVPDVKTHAIPPGLQVQQGPDAVVKYLMEQIPELLG